VEDLTEGEETTADAIGVVANVVTNAVSIIQVQKLGRVGERAVESTSVEGLDKRQDGVDSRVVNNGKNAVEISHVVEPLRELENGARRLSQTMRIKGGINTAEIAEERGTRDGELETRRARIANRRAGVVPVITGTVGSVNKVEITAERVSIRGVLNDEAISGPLKVLLEEVDVIEEVVVGGTHSVLAVGTTSITAALLATVGPVAVSVEAEARGGAVSVTEVNLTLVGRRTSGNTASILDREVIILIQDGDAANPLLNKRAVGSLGTNGTTGNVEAGEIAAINAQVGTAGRGRGNGDRGNAVTNPNIAILGGGLLKGISLATVAGVKIGVNITVGTLLDAHTSSGSTPDTVATETKIVVLVLPVVADQVTTGVERVGTSGLTLGVTVCGTLLVFGLNSTLRGAVVNIDSAIDIGNSFLTLVVQQARAIDVEEL